MERSFRRLGAVEVRPVTVQFYKHWGRLHWRHDMVYLGEDADGTWLGARSGGTVQRGHEPARAWPHAYVQLIIPDAWWTIVFNGREGRTFRQYVDIIEPARWLSGDRVEMVDLDIDVVEEIGGAITVLDQDEFDDHAARHGYPPELIGRAEEARDSVKQALLDRREPFHLAGERWLSQVSE